MGWNWQWFVVPGSAVCVLPLVLLIGLVVLRRPGGRAAVARWWIAVAGGVALVAASKIAFYGWGLGVVAWDLTCFSGHTVLSFALWPVALALTVPPARRHWRWLAISVGVAFALLVGLSRIKLGAHPASEVLAGILLGGSVAMIGLHALRRQWLPLRPSAGAILLLGGVMLLSPPSSHRFPTLPSERWLATVASTVSGREEPYDRAQWAVVSGSSTTPPARCGHLRRRHAPAPLASGAAFSRGVRSADGARPRCPLARALSGYPAARNP